MKKLLLCIAMLATACTTLDKQPGIRRTHQDRWQNASRRFEADLRERGVAERVSAPRASVASTVATSSAVIAERRAQ